MKNADIAGAMWELLWREYARRVPVARVYQEMLEAEEGRVVLDHVAFRSLRLAGAPLDLGIGYVARVLELLDYHAAGEYHFSERHLFARHYEHPRETERQLPKVSVSELLVEELPPPAREAITETVACARDELPSPSLNWLRLPEARRLELSDTKRETAMRDIAQFSTDLPWDPPCREALEAVAAESLYAAWVLVHGFAVNHIAADALGHGAANYLGIEKSLAGLAHHGCKIDAGEIEGARDGPLRQVGTDLVVEEMLLCDREGRPAMCACPYAYFELAERGEVEGRRFHAFIEDRTTDLLDLYRPPSLGHAVD